MKKKIIKPSILPGFMELLPEEQRIFNDIKNKITKVYEQNGCLAIDTPVIEKSQVLLAKSGGETEKQVYEFKKGSNDLALRFDLTVPFARYAAQHYNDLVFPFKRYQIGKVYRGERNQKGRYREFYQCDVDIIGRGSLSINNDAYVISLVSQAFKEIGLKDYKFHISNRKILKGIMEYMEIENTYDVMILIDKYDKMEKEEFNSALENLIGERKSEYINKIMDIQGNSQEILKNLEELNINNEIFLEGISELKKVTEMLKILHVGNDEFDINLKIIRGLDYYTGTVFETLLIGNEKYGSVCSGGRYDNLAENYTENILPGVGISIGLTRLFFVLKEIGFIDKYTIKEGIDYLIIPVGDTMEYCGKVLNALKNKNYSAAIYFEDTSLKKKMNFADKSRARFAVIIGENEAKQNNIMARDMKTGENKKLNVDI